MDRPPKTLNPENGEDRARARLKQKLVTGFGYRLEPYMWETCTTVRVDNTNFKRTIYTSLTFHPPHHPIALVVFLFTCATIDSTQISFQQHRPSDRIRKKVEYPEIKAEEVPPLMTIVSEK